MQNYQQLCGFTCSVTIILFNGFYLQIADAVSSPADFVGQRVEILGKLPQNDDLFKQGLLMIQIRDNFPVKPFDLIFIFFSFD